MRMMKTMYPNSADGTRGSRRASRRHVPDYAGGAPDDDSIAAVLGRAAALSKGNPMPPGRTPTTTPYTPAVAGAQPWPRSGWRRTTASRTRRKIGLEGENGNVPWSLFPKHLTDALQMRQPLTREESCHASRQESSQK